MSQSVCLAPAARSHSSLVRTASRSPSIASPGAILTGLVLQLLDWQRRARERDSLASLSDAELRDVGLTRADIFEEIHKPFWRA